jgi:adenylate kinase
MKNQNKIIFIGGIHGVGKTTFRKALGAHLEIKHFSASELIQRSRQENPSTTKRVEDINENQDLFPSALFRYTSSGHWNVIDGHFCLLDKDGNVTKIPAATFKKMSPSAILTIFDDVEKIRQRLQARDKSYYEPDLIRLFQDKEIEYSKYIAEQLSIPHLICKSNEAMNSGLEFIEELINGA